MKLGITGGSGFIGRRLRALIGKEHEMISLERDLARQYLGVPLQSLADLDAVLYLAGVNRGRTGDVLAGNVIPLWSLVKKVKQGGIALKIVFASTLQLYGMSTSPISRGESDAISPDNTYSLSKMLAEQMLVGSSNGIGDRVVLLRISNVYGPGCLPNYNSVVATYAHNLAKGEPLRVDGTGLQSRDFIFIDDLADAFTRSAAHMREMNSNFDVFNICSGVSTSINSLVEVFQEVYDTKVTIERKDPEEAPNHMIGDPAKAQRILGFVARTDLKSGIRRIRETVIDDDRRNI